MWLPQLNHQLDASGEWFASLPQIAFCLVLAARSGCWRPLQSPQDGYVAKRFGLLVWGFAVVGVLPVIAIGGEVTTLDVDHAGVLDPGQRGLHLLPVPGAPT